MSTLTIPADVPKARDDAKNLHDAFKGFGCNSSALIKILAHRDAAQREKIQQEYEIRYSEDLSKRISSELHGNLKRAFSLWMKDSMTRDASALRHALKKIQGAVTDHKATTEVICSRTPAQLRQLKQVYESRYGTRLAQDIEEEAHGDHKKLLLALINTLRYEGPEIDEKMVENDAKALHKVGQYKSEAAEKVFIPIFTDRSKAHITALNHAYGAMFGKPLEMVIKKETSGNFEYALLSILRCLDDTPSYFARVLRKAMKGLGTDDHTLIWVVVTRAEFDMQCIKSEYKKKYKKTLNDAVHSETSGHYRSFLLALLGPNC